MKPGVHKQLDKFASPSTLFKLLIFYWTVVYQAYLFLWSLVLWASPLWSLARKLGLYLPCSAVHFSELRLGKVMGGQRENKSGVGGHVPPHTWDSNSSDWKGSFPPLKLFTVLVPWQLLTLLPPPLPWSQRGWDVRDWREEKNPTGDFTHCRWARWPFSPSWVRTGELSWSVSVFTDTYFLCGAALSASWGAQMVHWSLVRCTLILVFFLNSSAALFFSESWNNCSIHAVQVS